MDAYKEAGVNIQAGYKAINLMKGHVKKTHIPGVISDLGGFGGLFEIKDNYKNPVLVSGTDGVGTKLKIAFIMDKHDTIGQDCVAMCVNDIVCSGAKPLFFLDYIALSKNVPEKVAEIVKGISDGCIKAGCSLIGGETAEMPGFYCEDEYDIAGFSVGIVEKDNILQGSNINNNDVLIGIGSSGLHSNGYSLVRKILSLNNENSSYKLNQYIKSLECKMGEELLKPTKIYVKPVLKLIERFNIKAVCHITGGGFYENIPRMLPDNMKAVINKDSWDVKQIFKILKDLGNISDEDMYNTFNMGIGMVLAVKKEQSEDVIKFLNDMDEKAYEIGYITEGNRGVDLC